MCKVTLFILLGKIYAVRSRAYSGDIKWRWRLFNVFFNGVAKHFFTFFSVLNGSFFISL